MIVKKPVSKENILSKINAFDIFKKYISNFSEVGRHFTSDLRKDNNPTCVVAKIGDNLLYKDFAVPGCLNCFDYVMHKYSVTFYQALEIINLDFSLGLLPNIYLDHVPSPAKVYNVDIDSLEKLPTEIRVSFRDWNLKDKKYWKDTFGITQKTLRYFQVYPLKGYWKNGEYQQCSSLTYGYYFGKYEDGRQGWKIYSPFEVVHNKWRGNASQDIYQGESQLPWTSEILIITKSLKDVMVLYELGIPSVAPQAESIIITQEKYNMYRKRFKRIVLLYDNDGPGVKATERICSELGIPHIYMPEGSKDASDFVKNHSLNQLKSYLKNQCKIIFKSPSPIGSIGT